MPALVQSEIQRHWQGIIQQEQVAGVEPHTETRHPAQRRVTEIDRSPAQRVASYAQRWQGVERQIQSMEQSAARAPQSRGGQDRGHTLVQER
jgi:hypothetical protein